MSEDSGTKKFRKEDLTTGGEQKTPTQESFTKDHIDELSNLFTDDSKKSLDDTGEFKPIKDTGEE